jgi:hypothetical protein
MEENRTDTQQANPNAHNAEQAFDQEALNQFGANAGSEPTNQPVENAFFQAKEEKAPGEAPQQEQAAPAQETPSQDAKNDERRYQYWQSQAAKRENEVKQMQAQMEQLYQAQANAQPTQQPAETVQEFPPPPEAPKKPARYSREEAWSDPSSESAKYLDEKESWDSDISEYNQLKHQYEIALMQEKLDNQSTFLQEQEKQRQNKIEQGRQVNRIAEHVQGHYGLSPEETSEFIQTMSNPESISMDNLVQLYRMNKGGHQPGPQPTGPSETFQQNKNAQQIPSPMGVMPAQGNQQTRNDEDSIMDDLINAHKSKNPWT